MAAPTGPGGTWNIYARIPHAGTFDQHRMNAENTDYMGTLGHLATVGSAAENSAVATLAGDSTFIGHTDATGISSLDGFDYSTLGTVEKGNTSGLLPAQPNSGAIVDGQRGYGFQNVDGTPNTYQNWAGGEPNDAGGHEDITELRGSGQWNDHNGGTTIVGGGAQTDNNNDAVYEFDTALAVKPVFAGNPDFDPISGQYYERISTGLNFDQARIVATTREHAGVEGHLATIASADENEFGRITGGTGSKWIGLHDSDQTSTIDGTAMGGTEGTFQWITGETVTYTNWSGGEPNNSGGSEDATVMTNTGVWNDASAGDSLNDGGGEQGFLIEYTHPFVGGLGGTLNYLERRPATTPFSGGVTGLNEAIALLGLPSGDPAIAAEGSAQVYGVSFHDPEGSGGLSNWFRRPFLTDTSGGDDDFAVGVTGKLWIETADFYTFAIGHDDEFQFRLSQNGVELMNTVSASCCSSARLLTPVSLAQGVVDLELFWFERGGGAYLQLFAAQGSQASFDANVFDLVGDQANGGIAIHYSPEPGTMTLLALGGLGLWRRRRRQARA
ncbi:PEP-CTERM sorting domain-containing protein [bacterium]|nr:PEP-CTERM sorting domain-containing protein [bacterium]